MESDDRRRSAEILKDMIVEKQRSRWPMILGCLAILAILGGAAYWFYLPPDQRPSLDSLISKAKSIAGSFMNAPIASKPAPTPAAPQKPGPPPPASDTGLLN